MAGCATWLPGMQEARAAEQGAPVLLGGGGEGAVLRLRGGGRGAVAGGRASAQTGGAATRDPLAEVVLGVGAAVEVQPSARSPEAVLDWRCQAYAEHCDSPFVLVVSSKRCAAACGVMLGACC